MPNAVRPKYRTYFLDRNAEQLRVGEEAMEAQELKRRTPNAEAIVGVIPGTVKTRGTEQ
ncbi:hypothetical protein [Streptomyces spinosirectus]